MALQAAARAGDPDPEVVQHVSGTRQALTTLTAREKTLLRLHFLDGMNIDALGVVFRVHRATVARWLVAIRTQVLDRVRQTLSLDLGASPSEAISLVRLLRSEVQLSIRRILEDGESVRLTKPPTPTR